MILDKLLQFDATATAASGIVTGGLDSANDLDMTNVTSGTNGRDLNTLLGEYRVEAVFTVETAFAATGGASSVEVGIYGVDSASTKTLLAMSAQIPKASLTAGTQIRVPLAAPGPGVNLPVLLRATYTAITNNITSGTFQCNLVIDSQTNSTASQSGYPPGVTVAN